MQTYFNLYKELKKIESANVHTVHFAFTSNKNKVIYLGQIIPKFNLNNDEFYVFFLLSIENKVTYDIDNIILINKKNIKNENKNNIDTLLIQDAIYYDNITEQLKFKLFNITTENNNIVDTKLKPLGMQGDTVEFIEICSSMTISAIRHYAVLTEDNFNFIQEQLHILANYCDYFPTYTDINLEENLSNIMPKNTEITRDLFVALIKKYKNLINIDKKTHSDYNDTVKEMNKCRKVKFDMSSPQQILTDRQLKNINLTKNLIKDSKKRRNKLIDELCEVIDEDTTDYISMLINNMRKYYTRSSVGGFGICGKDILNKYMDLIDIPKKNKELGISLRDYIETNADIILESMSKINYDIEDLIKDLYFSENNLNIFKRGFSDRDTFYAAIISILTGTPYDTLIRLNYRCNSYDLDLSTILHNNPYMLGLFAYDIVTPKRIEIFAQFFGKELDTNILLDKCRSITYLGQGTLLEESSTIFDIEQINRQQFGITITETQYNRLLDTGNILTKNQFINAVHFLGLDKNHKSYPTQMINHISFNTYIYQTKGRTKENRFSDCIESGFITRIGNMCFAITSDLEKEVYILKTMIKKSQEVIPYDIEDLREIVNSYNDSLPFDLNKEQRNAAGLLMRGAACITGVAGSGKTTLIKLFIRILNEIDGITNITFVAPTGRAAKRMREVLGINATTIHRHFKLGINNTPNLGFNNKEFNGKKEVCVLIIDETSMADLNTFYDMLLRLDLNDNDTRIYMFGDIRQLPPVGKGTPFRDLLYFLPNIKFNKCERTAMNSNITAMASQYILDDYLPIKSQKDLFLINTNEIEDTIQNLCRHYLQKSDDKIKDNLLEKINSNIKENKLTEIPAVEDLKAEDIQVISPVSKDSYSWGTSNLNSILHNIFNYNITTKNTYLCKVNNFSKPFTLSVGDRVMHVHSNMYNKCHYKKVGDREYTLIPDKENSGVFNGEDGIIVDILDTSDITLNIDENNIPEYCTNDNNWCADARWNNFFIVVQFYDDINNDNYYILYRASYNTPDSEDNKYYNLKHGLIGEDLSCLDLAYAITVHKSQGSEKKVVIIALNKMKNMQYSTFLSNELVYTAITRGSTMVYIVGEDLNILLKNMHNTRALEHTTTFSTKLMECVD